MYTTLLRPVIMYGTEMDSEEKRTTARIEDAEMDIRDFTESSEKKIKSKLKQVKVRHRIKSEKAGVRSLSHIPRREDEDPVKMAYQHPVEGRRSVGR